MQRDPRSDITQICGILFFIITGKNPTTFLDSDGNKPHQRTEIKQNLSVLSESILTKINRIFDRAFDVRIDYRWQSIPPLKEALMEILKPSNQDSNKTETFLAKIQNKISNSPDYAERKLFQNLAQQILEQIYDIVRSAAKELGSDFSFVLIRISSKERLRAKITWNNLTFSQQVVGIGYRFSDESFSPEFKGYITGNEVVLVSDIKGKEVELLRTPLSGEPDFTGFINRLKKFYYEGVESILP